MLLVNLAVNDQKRRWEDQGRGQLANGGLLAIVFKYQGHFGFRPKKNSN